MTYREDFSFRENLQNSLYFLIQQTSTVLPYDVQNAILKAKISEKQKSNAEFSLEILEKNIESARIKKIPMCQDTGFLTFYVSYPIDFKIKNKISESFLKQQIFESVKKATKNGLLRPNAVDSITGKNSGNNIGTDIPKVIFMEQQENNLDGIEIKLLMKGGGSENVSTQYSLPCQTDFGYAGRDLEGVKKVILQSVKNADGKGCAPGILGVHIGGDRGIGYEQAKKNFFRKIGDKNPEISLQKLEQEILKKANNLGIGPMGFGGKSTLLDVKISTSYRIPASFFVTVAYSCWALRRGEIFCDKHGKIKNISPTFILNKEFKNRKKEIKRNKEVKKLSFPLTEKDVLNLKVGDTVLLSGKIFTGRDRLHHYVVKEKKSLPVSISGSAIYHCGPIMKENTKISEKNKWKVISAGPTTSVREEPYQAEFIQKTRIRGIIGKGGMGEKTLRELKNSKAVYFHAIGGAGVVYSEKIVKVENVYFLEKFGIPEAMWEIEIKDFPVIVTMDAYGNIFKN